MTMMMTNSQFGLEDMEALLWEPSTPMADAMGSLFFNANQEEHPEIGGTLSEGDISPVSPLTSSSLSSSSSPPPFYSPPPSPMAVLNPRGKDGSESDMLSVPWLVSPEHLRCNQMVSDDRKEDVFGDLDWMTEKMDLSEIDLESLIGSCSPNEESPNSTEDLLASLNCPMELDSLPMPTLSTAEFSSPPPASLPGAPPTTLPTVSNDDLVITVDDSESISEQEAPSSVCVPEPHEELEIKSEPASPESPTPVVESASSPVYTLDLGSEVDVSESEVKPVLATVIPQVQRLVFSLSPTRIVLVLAPSNEVGVTTATVTTTSEVAHSSPSSSPPLVHPPQRSSRGRPYPEPKYRASPPSPSATSVKVKSLQGSDDDDDDDDDDDERVSLKAPRDKKMKKMEQNKTAATRYRQKKRVEQEALIKEHAQMERKNVELKEKAESMAREIEYLKELIEEVRSARIKKGLGPDL